MSVDEFLPELDIWTHFVTSDYCRALELDSLQSSHPIEVRVGPASEVFEIFDGISYSKGASMIRMLHNYVGDEVTSLERNCNYIYRLYLSKKGL